MDQFIWGSGKGSVESSFEYGNDYLGFVKVREFLDYQGDSQLPTYVFMA
jgi:hypothetical protein